MDKKQSQTILTKLAEFDTLNFDALVSQAFAPEGDLSQTLVNQMKVTEFVSLTKRIIRQLRSEILEGLPVLLPVQINQLNEFGTLNLQNDLTTFVSRCKNKDFKSAEGDLIRLTHYQLLNGFFDKPVQRTGETPTRLLDENQERLSILSQQLEKHLQLKEQIFKELEKKKVELTEFEAQKRKQLEQITQSLQTANQQTNQITELLTKSTTSSTRVDALLEQQKKNLDQTAKSIDTAKVTEKTLRDELTKLIDSTKKLITEFEGKNSAFKEQLAFVEGKRAYFEERNSYLDELIGREVGASLFSTFKQRKLELIGSLSFWKWGVFVMSIITVLGIFAIFTNLFGLTGSIVPDLSWERLSLNSLKTIPFFVLLFFTIRQYIRERVYQEEYAFKSAVALTIDAYSKLLKKDENKDKLILDAILTVYQSPVSAKDRSDSEQKTLLESMKNVSETVKNITKPSK